ncbi:MAG: hypothetical protein Q4F54_02440 [Coriobacteriia bacterium]|nr:hypothetical protein [Coriobacteriia bacterium]
MKKYRSSKTQLPKLYDQPDAQFAIGQAIYFVQVAQENFPTLTNQKHVKFAASLLVAFNVVDAMAALRLISATALSSLIKTLEN